MTDEERITAPEATQTETMLSGIVEEVLDLRHGEAGDPEGRLTTVDPNDGPEAVSHMLLRVRQRSDRVDYLLAQVTRARGIARRSRENARFESEFAYNTATSTNERNRTREFVSKEERHAAAALASLAEKRQVFLADRLVSHADEAYEIVNQVYRQFGDIRTDLRATLRGLQFESSLER